MGYIYKIVNDCNNKIYIGKTETSLTTRWNAHKCETEKQLDHGSSKIHDAMRKYGIEHFKIELVEECDNDIINIREQYQIDYFHSTDDTYGYNITCGGEGRIIYNRSLIKQYWDMGYSGFEIRALLQCSEWTLNVALNELGIPEQERRIRSGCAIPYNQRKHIVKEYISNCKNTIQVLAKKYNCSIQTIANILHMYHITESQCKIHSIQAHQKAVAMCDKDTGEIIKIFPSRKEAAQYVHGAISPLCSGIKNNGVRYGYRWKNA